VSVTPIGIPVLALPGLMITTDQDAHSVFVRMTGVADLRAARQLADFLGGLHRESVRTRIADATVDLRDVEFMSAPCFRGFVAWVGQIEHEPPEKQYKLTFIPNAERHWQRRSLQALAAMAPGLVTVE
jgi:hypothetical protein